MHAHEYKYYDNVTRVSFLFASWEPCNAAAGFSIDKGIIAIYINTCFSSTIHMPHFIPAIIASCDVIKLLTLSACAMVTV